MPNSGSLVPFFEEADFVTCTATLAVLGKQLVKISGDLQSDGTYSVAPCGAGDIAIAVASYNAVAGQKVAVAMIDGVDSILPLVASGAVAAGDHLTTAAAGAAITTTTAGAKCYAIALASAASGADIQAIMTRHTF